MAEVRVRNNERVKVRKQGVSERTNRPGVLKFRFKLKI
jgi:hypothetical protein